MKKYKIIGLLFLSIVIILSISYVYINYIIQKNAEAKKQEELEIAVDYFILGDPSLLDKTLEYNEENSLIFNKELDRRDIVVRDEFKSNVDLYFEYLEEKYNWKETHPDDYENNSTFD